MPAKKKIAVRKPITIEHDEIESIIGDTAYTADELSPALAALYDELGISPDSADSTVHITFIQNGKEFNVWKGRPDDYDLDQIAKQHGSGDYRVKLYVRNADGVYKPKRADKIFSYLLSPADEKKRRDNLKALNTPDQPVAQDVAGMMREMMQGFQVTLLQILQAQKPVEKDPMQTLQGLKELAEIIKPPSTDRPRGLMDVLTEARAITEFAKGIAPTPITDKDGNISSDGVLLRAMDMFGKAIDANRKGVSAVQPQIVNDEMTEADNGQGEHMNLIIKMQLATGVSLAKAGADYMDYASSLWELMPEALIERLSTDTDWFAKLVEIDARCGQYPEFFGKVRASIREWAIEDGIVQDLTTAKSGITIPANAQVDTDTGPAITAKN